jgi:ElaB/YqjD/DUF883 family membrane-anchored ribosome-binding protein
MGLTSAESEKITHEFKNLEEIMDSQSVQQSSIYNEISKKITNIKESILKIENKVSDTNIRLLTFYLVVMAGLVGYGVVSMNNVKDNMSNLKNDIRYIILKDDAFINNITTLSNQLCIKCHNNPNNMLKDLSYRFKDFKQFATYVRNPINNPLMPAIDENGISERELHKIWNKLK